MFDKNGLEAVVAAEDNDREYVLETCSDLSSDGQISCQMGFLSEYLVVVE